MIHFIGNQVYGIQTPEGAARTRHFVVDDETLQGIGSITSIGEVVRVSITTPPREPLEVTEQNADEIVNEADRAARHIAVVCGLGDSVYIYTHPGHK